MCLQLFISLLASLEVPSSKLENKFPTLLTCIDFSLLRAPPSSPLSAGPVVKPPAWVGLSGTSGEQWRGCKQSTEQPAKLPYPTQCLAQRSANRNDLGSLPW